jgi:hypothetical protein
MAIQKVNIPIPFHGGVDRRSDDNTAPASKLYRLENALFDDKDTVVLRGGQTEVTLPPALTDEITRAYTHGGAPVVETNLGRHYHLARSGASNDVQMKAPVYDTSTLPPLDYLRRTSVETSRVQNIPLSLRCVDVAYSADEGVNSSNTYCIVSEEQSGGNLPGVRISVRDVTTDKVLWSETVADDTYFYEKPRVRASADYYHVFYARRASASNDFLVCTRYINKNGNSAASAQSTVLTVTGTSTASDPLFDVSKMYEDSAPEQYFAVAAVSAGSGIVRSVLTDLIGGLWTTAVATTPGVTPRSLAVHAIAPTDGTLPDVVYLYGGSTSLRGRRVTFAGVAGSEVTVLSSSYSIGRVTATEDTTEDYGNFVVAVDVHSTSSDTKLMQYVYRLDIDLTTAGGPSYYFTNSIIAGEISIINNQFYLPLLHLSAEYAGSGDTVYGSNDTYFVINVDPGYTVPYPHCVARLSPGKAAATFVSGDLLAHSRQRIPGTFSSGSTFYTVYLKEEQDLLFAGITDDTGICAARAHFDFGSQLGYAEVNGITVLAGACPQVNDGVGIAEEGFHHPPEVNAAATQTVSSTGGTFCYGPFALLGSYTVYFTEAWTDSAGNWHESAPSLAYTFTMTGSNQYIEFPVVRPFSTKEMSRRRLLMYRTVNQASSTNTTAYLATTSADVFVDDDTDLLRSEPLNLSAAPTYVMPACRHITQFQDRLVVSGVEDGSYIFYSKALAQGYAPEFVSMQDTTFKKRLPNSFGRAVGAQEMDGKLAVLGEHRVGMMFGQGPDDTGAGEYGNIETLVSELGADWDAPRSIGLGPEGVWFQSTRGIRLLARGGGLAQVGPEIDELVSGNCVFVAGDAKNLVWFFDGSYAHIWDSKYQQWSKFTNFAAVDAVYALGRFYRFESTPAAFYYDEAAYLDGGETEAQALLETNWVQLANLLGYQRVYRMGLLIKDTTGGNQDGNLTVATAIDYVPTYTDEIRSVASPLVFQGPNYVLRHHLSRQKCSAMKFKIQWKGTGVAGRFRISGLTLEVGVKSGIFKNGTVI